MLKELWGLGRGKGFLGTFHRFLLGCFPGEGGSKRLGEQASRSLSVSIRYLEQRGWEESELLREGMGGVL